MKSKCDGWFLIWIKRQLDDADAAVAWRLRRVEDGGSSSEEGPQLLLKGFGA